MYIILSYIIIFNLIFNLTFQITLTYDNLYIIILSQKLKPIKSKYCVHDLFMLYLIITQKIKSNFLEYLSPNILLYVSIKYHFLVILLLNKD